MAQKLEAMFALTDEYTATMRRIFKSQDTFEKKQLKADKAIEHFNKSVSGIKDHARTGKKGINSIYFSMLRLVSLIYTAKKAFDVMFKAVNISAMQKIQETTFQSLLNSQEMGTKLYKYISAYAKVSALGREDIATATISFLNVTKDIDQIERMIQFVERLQAKDPSKGIGQAIFSLKELTYGDVKSARDVYGIMGIKGEELRALRMQGDISGMLDLIDEGLNSVGATTEVVAANYKELIIQTDLFTSNLKTAIGEKANPLMVEFSELMQRLNENFAVGKYEPFINLMIGGMSVIGNMLIWIGDNINWLTPVLGGLVTGLIAYQVALKSVHFWTALTTIATKALTGNWVQAVAIGAGLIATAWGLSKAFGAIDEAAINMPSADELKAGLSGLGDDVSIPVEVSNTAPIKVKGEVDIKQENLKYLFDVAGKKFFAEFNANTVAPQVIMQGTQVYETTDLNEVSAALGNMIYQQSQAEPQGVY